MKLSIDEIESCKFFEFNEGAGYFVDLSVFKSLKHLISLSIGWIYLRLINFKDLPKSLKHLQLDYKSQNDIRETYI